MKFEELKLILDDWGKFRVFGSLRPPNNRVIFKEKENIYSSELTIVVQKDTSYIYQSGYLIWSFNLNLLNHKDLFKMMESFADENNEWVSFKKKWMRNQTIDKILV